MEHNLKQMETTGVVSKVCHPTDWCVGMVVVQKKSGNVHICDDMKPLNGNVLRDTHPMPHVDDTLAQLAGARIFSKLDANSEFWQILLAPSCRYLTTFITPFGRYWFNKLPFGISSAPEVFQKQMSLILKGLPGVLCYLDDILVYGRNTEEHNSRLRQVLVKIRSVKLILNPSKCEFTRSSITFLGHVINKKGISADPQKLLALKQIAPLTNVTELRRFIEVVNQFSKCSKNFCPITETFEHKDRMAVWTRTRNIFQTFDIRSTYSNNSHILQSISAYQDLSRCLLIRPWSCFTSPK